MSSLDCEDGSRSLFQGGRVDQQLATAQVSSYPNRRHHVRHIDEGYRLGVREAVSAGGERGLASSRKYLGKSVYHTTLKYTPG